MPENKNDFEFRVLVSMPTGRDGALVCQTLANAGLAALNCADFSELEQCLGAGAGAILLAEEALNQTTFRRFVETVQQQEVWSDIPVVLLAADQRNAEKLLNTVGTLLNITIVERPLPKAILVSAMRGAIRARKKQYQSRDLLAELKEADSQKDLFLATLSHELRTPLNSMLGWIELLKSRVDNERDKAHALGVIERNAKAQTQIINDILLLSRIVTGKFEITPERIDLNSVVQAAIDTIEPAANDKKIDLDISFPKSDCIIEGDFDRLQQVFWNLLSNAVKFTPEEGRIRIESYCENSFFSVRISDNGRGISPDVLPFIFERFRQADNSYTRTAGGLGLGLAIVRNIIEQHGGNVTVESAGEGCGAAFTVKLPIAAAAAQNAQPGLSITFEPQSALSGLRILLAEDDEDSREMLTYLLEEQRVTIEAVASASAALASFAENPPHILISDVGMPDMDGYQLIQKIRELSPEQGGKVPAIALTGYAGSQDKIRSLESGFQAHLSKPIDFDELFETIRKIVGGANMKING